MKTSSVIGRVAALIALAVAVVAAFLLLSGSDTEYEVTSEFRRRRMASYGRYATHKSPRVRGGEAYGGMRLAHRMG